MVNIGSQIVEAIDRLYRLNDSTFNGTQYEVADGVITPPIPAVPPASTGEGNALRAHVGRLWTLAENAHTGATFSQDAGINGGAELPVELSWQKRLEAVQGLTGGFFGIGATPTTLTDLLKSSRVNTAADQGVINDGIEEVLGALAAGGSLSTALSTLLSGAADVASDGGLAAVQIAIAVAQQVTAGLLGGQIDRLISALDGGGLVGPATGSNNVLALLNTGLIDSDQLGLAERTREIALDAATISERLGSQVNGMTSNEQLDAIRQALRSLAGLEAAGAVATGSALQLQLAVLECICQGVSGTPPSFPIYTAGNCNSAYTVRATVPLVPFDATGVAAPVEFEMEADPGGIITVEVPGLGSCLAVGQARELCIQVVRAGGGANENLGFVCTPYKLTGVPGSRPTVQLQGLAAGDSGFFEAVSSDNGSQIAYYITLGNGLGTPVAGQYRIYLSAGAVG